MKVVVCIPAGRQRYMEVLMPHLLRERGYDELHIWLNTNVASDVAYLRSLPAVDARIKLVEPPRLSPDGIRSVGQYFGLCTDPDTVYVRFDDDICYIEPGLIPALVEYRIAHPEFFLVAPATVNQVATTFILQSLRQVIPPYYVLSAANDPTGWGHSHFAEALHRLFLECLADGNIDRFKFEPRMHACARFSINCISWLGSTFAEFDGEVPDCEDDEEYVSAIMPVRLNMPNAIFGHKLVAHYSYFTQREYLDSTDILAQYAAIAAAVPTSTPTAAPLPQGV